MTPRSEGRYEAVPEVTLESLDARLSNVERILLAIREAQAPRWLTVGGWTSIIGAALGAAVKALVGG